MHIDGNHPSKYSIKSIFHDVQFSKSNHSSYKNILTEIFKKTNVHEFLEEFVLCLKICLMHEDKSANVERTLDFAADFAVSFSSNLKEDETCPLLEGVFQFIFDNHDCHIQLVRLRICQLMNRLLDNMGQDATVVENTYNKIAESMLVRLQDLMTSVRTQAVYALHRLQSPNDPDCDIIKAFMYHMTHDPCHEVRRAVIQKIAVNKMTLASILTRMNDVKDSVRKEAYTIISRFLIRQFTIKQRQLILESGLGDRSEVTRDYVVGVLVPNWLKYFNYNYYEFLECIHVEKIPDTGIKLLKAIFAKQHDVILESRLKDMWIINQKIAYNKLNAITVVYWRALAEYVKPTDGNDKFEHIFEQVLPDLTPFCKYIREYVFPQKALEQSTSSENEPSLARDENLESSQEPNRSQNSQENVGVSLPESETTSTGNTSPEVKEQGQAKRESKENSHEPDEFVLVHLLEMCKVYDLADEMGRSSLRQLCVDFLQSDVVTLQSIAVLANLLDHAEPSVSSKLSVMAEIITELREPLQANDNSVYVPDLLLQEAEEKKAELGEKLIDLESEMEIAQELGDDARVEEIKVMKINLKEELKIMNAVTPHEPGRNVNNDPDTLIKCLTIVVEIMKNGKITKMNPTLYSLMQNFIIPTLKLKVEGEGSTLIKNLALRALGIFCVLDAELAKEHFMLFCFNIANETLSVTALKCVFDLLHIYGLANFNIEDPDEVPVNDLPDEDGPQKPNLVVLLMSLLNSESSEMRKTAVIGLCKLLLAGRIKSSDLVSKLIVLWYNPIIECDPHIRQPLGVFFRMFASSCRHAPALLLKAFIPTIKEFFRLEITDPMIEVEVESVANLIIELTRSNFNHHSSKELSVHNQMAIKVCEEVLTEEHESANCSVLLKILGHLELNFNLSTDIRILSALASQMVKSIPKEDKSLTRLANKFETMLQVHQDSNKTVSTVNNTLPAEISLRSSCTSRPSQLLLTTREDSESESEADPDEEEELSPDATVSRIFKTSEDIVIPGTPESSDSELDDGFKGFGPSVVKSAKISQDSDFKFPSAPSCRHSTKTPAKSSSRTPAKSSARTLAKTNSKTPAKANLKTPAKANSKTPAKTPAKTRNLSPTKNNSDTTEGGSVRTPFKTPSKTPSKTTRSTATSPDKSRGNTMKTPEKLSPQNDVVTERVTRSSRKRKS